MLIHHSDVFEFFSQIREDPDQVPVRMPGLVSMMALLVWLEIEQAISRLLPMKSFLPVAF